MEMAQIASKSSSQTKSLLQAVIFAILMYLMYSHLRSFRSKQKYQQCDPWQKSDSNPQPLSSEMNTQPFSQMWSVFPDYRTVSYDYEMVKYTSSVFLLEPWNVKYGFFEDEVTTCVSYC